MGTHSSQLETSSSETVGEEIITHNTPDLLRCDRCGKIGDHDTVEVAGIMVGIDICERNTQIDSSQPYIGESMIN
jgi:uncharacterized Zn finger protein